MTTHTDSGGDGFVAPVKHIRFEFTEPGVRLPAGTRVLQIAGEVVRIPGNMPDTTAIFIHPDDVAAVVAANSPPENLVGFAD